jgi:hypothetical protein
VEDNGFHSTCLIEVGVWISYGKIRTFHDYRFLRICENVFRKVERRPILG